MNATILIPWVLAAAPEVHDDLRQLISADHGYVQRREELIAKARADSAIATELAAIAKRVDEVSWREAVFAEAILTHMTHPEWVEDVARPSGLVPSVYLKGRPRRPVPLLSLSRMDESAVPLLFELWFKAEELGAYSTDGDFPAALPAAEKSRLRTLEREALPPVILHLVAGRKHAAAPFLIREVALGRPSSLRDTALTALGETQSPVALQALRSVVEGPDELARGAAIVGLSAMQSADGFELVLEATRRASTNETRVAGLRGLLRFAVRGPLKADQADAIVALMARETNPGVDDATVELATQIAKTHPQAWARVASRAELASLRRRVATRLEWAKRRAR